VSSKVKRYEDRVHKLEPSPPDQDRERCRKVVEMLTKEEQIQFARAIHTLEESGGCDSLETLPPEQKAAWIRAWELYEEGKP
jgi:hypothetical protein